MNDIAKLAYIVHQLDLGTIIRLLTSGIVTVFSPLAQINHKV